MSGQQVGASASRANDLMTRAEVQALINNAGSGGSTAAVTANRAPTPTPPIGSWIWQPNVTVESQRPPNGELRLHPVWLPPGTYDSVAWLVNNAGSAGATIKAVAYSDNDGALGALALETANVDAATNTGTYQVTGLNVVSPAAGRLLWVGLVNQGAPSTLPNLLVMGRISQSVPLPSAALSLQFTNNIPAIWLVTGVTGAAPATPSATLSSGGPARVLFRRSA